MNFSKFKLATIMTLIGASLSASMAFAQTAGSLNCSPGQCYYSNAPVGTAHWEWSIYRIGGGGGRQSLQLCGSWLVRI